MATRVKDSPPGKSLAVPGPGLTGDQKQEPVSSTEKRIPNYLKPTKSSVGLASTSDAARKPTLSRRRSFGAPPPPPPKTRLPAAGKPTLTRRLSFDHRVPPSLVAKTSVPPPPGVRRLRSSMSFSARSTASASRKGLTGRVSKASKETVSGKNAGNAAEKQDAETTSMKLRASDASVVSIASSGDIVEDPDMSDFLHEEDPQPLLTDEVTTYNENEILAEAMEVEHKIQQHLHPTQPEPEIQEREYIKKIESCEVTADQEPEDHDPIIKETSDKIPEPEQIQAGNEPKAGDENRALNTQDVDNGRVAIDSKEIQEVKDAATEEVKQEARIPDKQKSQLPVQAKKEGVVSNDVIEETASKLREQRKSKVKALAGAFETVISLQDSSK